MKYFRSMALMMSLIWFCALAARGEQVFPYLPGAAWPVMRGDLQNSGRGQTGKWEPSPDAIKEVRRFHTGNGIFSTPVIGDRERIYVGSADHYFYALDPVTGKLLWKFDAQELIDSAAALSADRRVYVPAGGAIYALDLEGHPLWSFDVTDHRPPGLYTFGTNFWWEGNVVLGPDGNLYAGNDDFFFYSFSPEGKFRWARRTGFLIWSVPAFGPDDIMYFAGFDMRLYALERETGKLKWKKNLKNALVASPALGPDGTIFQGSFDGALYALNSVSGRLKWKYQTDDHIYASAALDSRGRVYVTSADGFLYALDANTGAERWTYYTGDAVRSSPVLGPDPEGKAEYLIYFGGGQGEVFAIDPEGKRRWSFNTLAMTGRIDYPNLNASPALGRDGIALANANGDVFYIPYQYYLKPDAKGISRDPSDGFGAEGAHWHYVSPGGLIDQQPESESVAKETRLMHPFQAIIARLIVRENGRTIRAKLVPGSGRVQAEPAADFRIAPIGDGKTLCIIPEQGLDPGKEYLFHLTASYQGRGGQAGKVSATLKLRVAEAGVSNPLMSPGNPSFAITHMSFAQPAIVPSLDQIGIAVMRIPFTVVETDPARGTFVAWSVQKWGASAGGEEQGIPDSRSLFYAFSGKVQGDFFELESRNCFFEESSFPFPLDLLRFSGRIALDGTVEKDASLLAELDPPGILNALNMLSVSSEADASGQKKYVSSTLSGGGDKGFAQALMVSGPTVLGYIADRVWRKWGFYNDQGNFVGAGTFRIEPPAAPTLVANEVKVKKFEYDPRKKELVAEAEIPDADQKMIALAILLVDKNTGRPVPINYNTSMTRQRLGNDLKRTTLKVPAGLRRGSLRAYLMADLTPVKMIEF